MKKKDATILKMNDYFEKKYCVLYQKHIQISQQSVAFYEEIDLQIYVSQKKSIYDTMAVF